MASPAGDPRDTRIADLEAEVARLRKINRSLMGRVERTIDAGGDSFGLFQNALLLETKVRERTRTLETLRGELEDSNRDLIRARDEAEAVANAKAAFLATMSHEIRTPLNGMLGMLQLVMGNDLDAGTRQDLEMVRSSASTLMDLLDGILDFSKLEAGKFETERVPFEPMLLAEDIVSLFVEQARSKAIALSCSIDPRLPDVVEGDVGAIRQVLTNLIGNAIKFTDAGAVRVRVGLDESGPVPMGCFEVADTGDGIAEAKLHRLFQPFSQADSSTTRSRGGTGLGLAICRRLCEMMGGEIDVESRAGAGSRFWFRVPFEIRRSRRATSLRGVEVGLACASADTAAEAARHLRHHGAAVAEITDPAARAAWLAAGGGGRRVLFVELAASGWHDVLGAAAPGDVDLVLLADCEQRRSLPAGIEGRAAAVLAPPFRVSQLLAAASGANRATPEARQAALPSFGGALRVLVAEDNPVNQVVTRRTLERLGCVVELVGNGEAAVAALRDGCGYDLVLMDLQMPGMDGYEAARTIRALGGACSALPIIALTANAMSGDRDACLDSGMDDFLSKPVRVERLAEALARWSRRAERR